MVSEFFRKRQHYTLIIIASFILGGSLFFMNSKSTSSRDTTNFTPTLFVHGFKGGPGSFNTMLQRFDHNNWGSKSMMIHVSTSGDLFILGTISNEINPFIQIVFENNHASIESQTAWLQKIMATLRETYDIKQVNLVGHSMGGLASTNFLLNNQAGSYPRVEKLAVIGSPFKGIDTEDYFAVNTGEATVDLRTESQALLDMVDKKANFDETIAVLTIAGVINGDVDQNQGTSGTSIWDGLVSLSSALGIKDIVPHSRDEIFYDAAATHSGLHEHLGVDQILAEFLWGIQGP